MTPRTNPFVAAPQLVQQLIDYGKTFLGDALEPGLLPLIAIRASQINGAASGLQRYVSEARRRVRPTCGSTSCAPGGKSNSTASASARRSPGPRP